MELVAAAYERYFLDSRVEEERGSEVVGVTLGVLGEAGEVCGLKGTFEFRFDEEEGNAMDEEFILVLDRVVTDNPPDLDKVDLRD